MNRKGGKKYRQQLNREAAAKRWKKYREECACDPEDCSPACEPKSVATKRKLNMMKSASPPSTDPSSPVGFTSVQPQPCSSSCEDTQSCEGQSQSWCIVEIGQLNKLIILTVCPECMTMGCLTVVKGGAQSMGFAQPLHLQCGNGFCGYESEFVYFSPRVGGTERVDALLEINTRMTLYATQIGKGHEALEAVKTVLGTETIL